MNGNVYQDWGFVQLCIYMVTKSQQLPKPNTSFHVKYDHTEVCRSWKNSFLVKTNIVCIALPLLCLAGGLGLLSTLTLVFHRALRLDFGGVHALGSALWQKFADPLPVHLVLCVFVRAEHFCEPGAGLEKYEIGDRAGEAKVHVSARLAAAPLV